ncbi:hypothetical protein ES703_107983 [subsurface metagenome]
MGYETGEEDDGFVKLIVDKSYRILGAHVIGPHAALLVQPFVYLMNSGFTCSLPELREEKDIPNVQRACPEAGSFMPIYHSMVIHPSLNEVTGWAIGTGDSSSYDTQEVCGRNSPSMHVKSLISYVYYIQLRIILLT